MNFVSNKKEAPLPTTKQVGVTDASNQKIPNNNNNVNAQFSLKRNDTADVTHTKEYIENQNAKLKEDVKVLNEYITKNKTLTRGKV